MAPDAGDDLGREPVRRRELDPVDDVVHDDERRHLRLEPVVRVRDALLVLDEEVRLADLADVVVERRDAAEQRVRTDRTARALDERGDHDRVVVGAERLLLELAQQRMVAVREVEQRRDGREPEQRLERRQRPLDDERGDEPVEAPASAATATSSRGPKTSTMVTASAGYESPARSTARLRSVRDAIPRVSGTLTSTAAAANSATPGESGVDEQHRHDRRQHRRETDDRVDQQRDEHRECAPTGTTNAQVEPVESTSRSMPVTIAAKATSRRRAATASSAAPHEGLHPRQVDPADRDEQQSRRGTGQSVRHSGTHRRRAPRWRAPAADRRSPPADDELPGSHTWLTSATEAAASSRAAAVAARSTTTLGRR
jgi:hypothetical protein